MQPSNRYYNRAKISEAKFRCVLRLFALDLTASDTARLTGLSGRAVNDLYLRLRHRLQAWCPVPAGLDGAVELTKATSGRGGCAANGAAGRAAKPSSSVCSNAAGRGTRKSSPTAQKRRCRPSYAAKNDSAAMVNTGGWRGYDGLMDVGFDSYFRVRHGRDEFVQGASHIKGIASFWSFAKARLHPFKGVPKHTFLLHLKESEFRFNHRYEDLYKLLLKLLRQQPL